VTGRISRDGAKSDVLVSIEHVVKEFKVRSARLFARTKDIVHAVSDVTLDIRRGETLALVGETGCGKSTLARCVVRLHDLTSGRIIFDGQDISSASERAMRPVRRRMQMIFQDPYGSLNPRRRVGSIIGDPFEIHDLARGDERIRQFGTSWSWSGSTPSISIDFREISPAGSVNASALRAPSHCAPT
jgi:ABC-type microcin C transport system duplicated ATPase subunit YejF